MVRSQKRKSEPKEKLPQRPISRKQLAGFLKASLSRKCRNVHTRTLRRHRIKELLQEETLQCPICLQLFLSPVLTNCGHLFCLPCAEDLAKNNYACGMCRGFEHTYDLSIVKPFQKLVQIFLSGRSPEERQDFERRQKELQDRERGRQVGQLNIGDRVDFWCEEEKNWKCGAVMEISKSGVVSLEEEKSLKNLRINILSRRLARLHFYTKDETSFLGELRGIPALTSLSNSPAAHFLGMPLFFNFFEEGGVRALEARDIYNFLPGYRTFF